MTGRWIRTNRGRPDITTRTVVTLFIRRGMYGGKTSMNVCGSLCTVGGNEIVDNYRVRFQLERKDVFNYQDWRPVMPPPLIGTRETNTSNRGKTKEVFTTTKNGSAAIRRTERDRASCRCKTRGVPTRIIFENIRFL